ncbi:nicotinamide/nicotinic acid mononucleotide adenylyltransferase 2 [Anaeramoeba ignava]|uniref:Nicotinamide-nucleotide adenylyltransferase n=1 Tax=Anaeramoeba ignava TaxID=1746090 RepID=A0A9Q0LJI5_ANAIG|nr:nicotinamide/nicotinic acid mononucleotide adenylyltransferase 2 [Anaeramoeba ignava]
MDLYQYKFPQNKLQFNKIIPQKDSYILVLFGSFNPPTIAHLRSLESISNFFKSKDKNVIGGYLSPVNTLYTQKNLESEKHRATMCDLATSSSSWIMVDKWECTRKSYVRTFTALEHFKDEIDSLMKKKKIKTNIKIPYLCGQDIIDSMIEPNGFWVEERVLRMISKFGLIVVQREDPLPSKKLEQKIKSTFLNDVKDKIEICESPVESSTLARSLIKKNLSAKYLLADPVIDYIKRNQLYRL